MSCLVQILLPAVDKDGAAFSDAEFERVSHELTERFGGVTAFTRAPAEGRWKQSGITERDEILVFEVMTDELDRAFWTKYRSDLELRFRQNVIVIRAQETEVL